MSRLSMLSRPAWLSAALATSWVIGCGGDGPPTDGNPPPPPPTVSITSTNPSVSSRGVTLDVRVLGSGFDQGSRAIWAQNGTAITKVKTNSTTFVSASELVANITIQPDTPLAAYDVMVTTSDGKSGTGRAVFGVWLEIEFIDLGAGDSSEAGGVNNLGQIVGTKGGAFGTQGSQAFLWENGTIRDLGVLPGMTYSAAEKINERGQVVGASGNGSEQRAFVWTSAGDMQALSSLGGSSSVAHAINDLGDIAGESRIPGVGNATESHAVVWRNGVITDLDAAPSLGSRAWDINNVGEVVGRYGNRAFVWPSGGQGRVLEPRTGVVDHDNALGIDDAGRIVGFRRRSADGRLVAYLWTAGQFQEWGSESSATGINSKGQVVGVANGAGSAFPGAEAFIWEGAEQGLGLPQGMTSGRALDINDNGWVVGVVSGPGGHSRAVLWKVK